MNTKLTKITNKNKVIKQTGGTVFFEDWLTRLGPPLCLIIVVLIIAGIYKLYDYIKSRK